MLGTLATVRDTRSRSSRIARLSLPACAGDRFGRADGDTAITPAEARAAGYESRARLLARPRLVPRAVDEGRAGVDPRQPGDARRLNPLLAQGETLLETP